MQAIDASVSDPRGSGGVLALALAFFAAGCVLALTTGASLAALHAFAAFIVLAFVAASNQLIPVLTGAAVSAPRAVLVAAAPLAAGFALLIASFLGAPLFEGAGVLLLLGAVGLGGWTISRLLGAPRERSIAGMIGFATVAFVAAATIGAAMTFALAGRVGPGVLALAPMHALLALAAFASTAIVAVSVRFVPMFALAHVAQDRRQAIARWTFVGATAFAAACFDRPDALRAALVVMLGALGIAGSSHLHELHVRLRRHLDISLRYAGIAWICAMLAVAAALSATWWPPAAYAAVALAVLGWASITIVGYAYKIAGFLAWQFARKRRPGAALPALSAAVPERCAIIGLLLLATGTLATASALAVAPAYVRWAFVPYAGGAIAVFVSYARLAQPYVGGTR